MQPFRKAKVNIYFFLYKPQKVEAYLISLISLDLFDTCKFKILHYGSILRENLWNTMTALRKWTSHFMLMQKQPIFVLF